MSGVGSLTLRDRGFLDALKAYPNIQVVSHKDAGGDQSTKPISIVADTLTRFPNLAGYFADSLITLQGALTAFRENRTDPKKISLVGFDPSPQLVRALRSGSVDGIILQDPYQMGYGGVAYGVLAAAGVDVPKNIDTGVFAATPENVDSPQIQASARSRSKASHGFFAAGMTPSVANVTPERSAGTPATRDDRRLAVWTAMLRLGLVGIIVVLFVVFAAAAPGFLSVENIENNARQMAVVGIIAVGETFVIITAGIDLSVGSLLGFGGILAALSLSNQLPVAFVLPIVITAGLAVGLLNGALILGGALPPFIVTLGMLGVLRGLTQILGNGQQVAFDAPGFVNFASDSTFGIPNLFWVLLGVSAICGIFLHFTRRGRYIYAVGSNRESARRAGVNVGATILTVYAISGVLAALGGLLITARQSQGDPNAGTGFELDAIAAAVLGGASLFGARGTIAGTFLGVLLVQIMTNGLNLMNFDPQVARMLEGALIIAFVFADQHRKRLAASA